VLLQDLSTRTVLSPGTDEGGGEKKDPKTQKDAQNEDEKKKHYETEGKTQGKT